MLLRPGNEGSDHNVADQISVVKSALAQLPTTTTADRRPGGLKWLHRILTATLALCARSGYPLGELWL